MQEVIEGFRTSPQQRRLLALGGAGRLAGLVVQLRGPLDPAALRAALDRVAAEWEALRTRLVGEPGTGTALQVIGDDLPAWEPDEDWSGVPAAEVERRVDAWVAETLATPADPSRPPLVRAALAGLGPDGHLLRLRVPAALADARTLGLLAARLAAELRGAPPAGEALQLADVAEWQHGFLESDEAAEGRRFWKRHLQGGAGPELPAGEPGDGGAPAGPRLLPVAVPPELLPRLEAAAAGAGVPLQALVLSGWVALLHRLTSRPEVRLGVAFDGRGFQELRDVAGPLARHLPVECAVAEDTPLPGLARALDRALAETGRWQDSFPEDAAPGEPVAPLGFAWHPLPESPAAGWRVREALACPEPFQAALLCAPGGGGLGARLLYDPARLGERAAARLAEEAAAALGSLARAPGGTVGALEVVGPREREWLLSELAATPGPGGPEGETVLDRFLAAADAWPGRTALRWDGGEATYAGLRARAAGLAAALRAHGVGPEGRVAILLDRTGDAVAAMLAAMWAGGAYVPLDPAFPRERLAWVLRDSGAAVLVTDGAGAGLADDAGCRVVRADAEHAGGEEPAPGGASPEGAAYLIYTSGTTGLPKAAVVEHRALARYVRAATAALELPPGAAYAVVSTLAADLGATMLWPALCLGGTLHLVPERASTDPDAWAEYAARHAVDCLKVVPSHLRLLLEGSRPAAALPRLRLVLGGEAADRELVERVRALAPGCRVFNHYGPTETTVGVVAGELAAGDGAARPPLGRPLPGARIYLLDAPGRPVPAGAAGEVHVGGGTLARGYLGRPEATADRWIPDPFSGEPGARLYRTGDLARWLPDGRLEFLGRLDDQVKVNGWRVEPAEVEAVLAAHPAVAASRVVPRGADGARSLVAYVAAVPGGAPDAAELRRHLRERLPEAFVPASFVLLPRLPLTPNGKVDLRALAAAGDAAAPPRGEDGPRGEAEAALAAVWEEVLGRTGVGASDDFFELGGNSFLAVRLMSRIHKRFGRRLPLAALIGAGTVRRMAALLESEGGGDAAGHLVEIRPGGALPPLFCIHPGEGTVLCYRALAAGLDPERPVHGLQALDFEMDRPPLVGIREMAARYVAALTARHPSGPYLLAGWSFGGLVAFEAARQLAARGAEVARLLLLDCRLPVTGAALGRVDPALHRLSMLFHASLLVQGGRPVVTGEELAGLDAPGQLELVARRRGVPAASLLPRHVPAEKLERYLELRMARTRGILEYGWEPVSVPITLLRAGEVELDTPFPEIREAYERAARTPDYGWGALTSRGVEVLEVPGTHHTMMAEPHVRELARAVDLHLAAVRTPAPAG